ncbi:kinase-like protein [Piedraia hortae CBS 480.64]|uniref:Kinase-like protein n=1 Tax=Piedraia hortae CBS 480.64 TaxID=1314780 RepID=A0A6A7C1K5_9PEZI|nr:kinase-like protein [Piedraia hortae CBS 480.64]
MADPGEKPFPYECANADFEALFRHIPGGFHPVHLGDILHNERYRILHKLGYGSFSTVWAARDEQKQRYVAIKIPVADAPSTLETSILRTLAESKTEHPGMAYLPTLLDEFELVGPNGTHNCIVTEVYGVSVGLDLEDEHVPLLASAARRRQREVLQAVDCLHQHGIVHGDLYTGNVVWTLRGVDDLTEEEFLRFFCYAQIKEVKSKDGSPLPPNVPRYLVKHDYRPTQAWNEDDIMLIDFGQAFHLNSPPDGLVTPLQYRAPEIVFEETLDEKVDVWSAGMLCFVLLTTFPPIDPMILDEDELIDALIKATHHQLPERWQEEGQEMISNVKYPASDDYANFQAIIEAFVERADSEKVQDLPTQVFQRAGDLFEKTLRLDPKERISAKEALELDWFKDTSSPAILTSTPGTSGPTSNTRNPDS